MPKLIFFLLVIFAPSITLAAEGLCLDSRHAALGDHILRMSGMREWAKQAIDDQIAAYTTPADRALIYATPRAVLRSFIDFEKQCRRLVKAEKKGRRSKAETPVVKYVMGVIRQEATARGLDPAGVLAAMFKQFIEE